MIQTRRDFCRFTVLAPLSAAIAAARCGSTNLPTTPSALTPPVDNRQQPLPEVTSALNGTTATLKYYGYAGQNETLLDALQRGNFSPAVTTEGLVTALVDYAPPWGWEFYVQNNFFGVAVMQESLNPGDLWAAYIKQSQG